MQITVKSIKMEKTNQKLKKYIIYAHQESNSLSVIERDAPDREKQINQYGLIEMEDFDTIEELNMGGRKHAFLSRYDWKDYEAPIVEPAKLDTTKFDF